MSKSFADALKELPGIEHDIQPGDEVSAGLGVQVRYDEQAHQTVEEHFDFPHNEQEPGQEIFNHFTERRNNYRDLDEDRVSRDQEGNPVFSDLVEEQIGECVEMALVGVQHAQEEAEEVYLVNGSLPSLDELNYKVPEHAYLILEQDNGQFEVYDPSRILGEEPVRGTITDIGESNTLILDEETQTAIEQAYDKRYSL